MFGINQGILKSRAGKHDVVGEGPDQCLGPCTTKARENLTRLRAAASPDKSIESRGEAVMAFETYLHLRLSFILADGDNNL